MSKSIEAPNLRRTIPLDAALFVYGIDHVMRERGAVESLDLVQAGDAQKGGERLRCHIALSTNGLPSVALSYGTTESADVYHYVYDETQDGYVSTHSVYHSKPIGPVPEPEDRVSLASGNELHLALSVVETLVPAEATHMTFPERGLELLAHLVSRA